MWHGLIVVTKPNTWLIHISHYDDVIMGAIASQITSLTIVYSTVYSGADQSKHQSSASLAFVWGIHRGPVNSPHKWPVTRKMFPFDDVIMISSGTWLRNGKKFWNILSEEKMFMFVQMSLMNTEWSFQQFIITGSDDSWAKTYGLLNLKALKISKLYWNRIFQCMGKMFCVDL